MTEQIGQEEIMYQKNHPMFHQMKKWHQFPIGLMMEKTLYDVRNVTSVCVLTLLSQEKSALNVDATIKMKHPNIH